MRQGSSSARLQGQSCWVPRGCSSREGFWNENSLFSGLAASQLPVRLRVSYNKRTATHSLEGKQEVREESRAQDAQDHWGRDWILFFLEHRCVSNSCLRHSTMVQSPSNSTTRPREEVLFWPQVFSVHSSAPGPLVPRTGLQGSGLHSSSTCSVIRTED